MPDGTALALTRGLANRGQIGEIESQLFGILALGLDRTGDVTSFVSSRSVRR